MRLLFGREFTFDDTLGIWDQLFALDPTLELVDFVCVAMILRIRWNRKRAPCEVVDHLLNASSPRRRLE